MTKALNLVILLLFVSLTVSAQELAKMPARSGDAIIKLSHDYFKEYESIKANPKRIIEKSYGKRRKFKYKPSKLSGFKIVYSFSDKNLIERKEEYFKIDKRGDWLYQYDEKGNEISEIRNYGKEKGKAFMTTILRYDSLGRIGYVQTRFSRDEVLYTKTNFIYSSNGDTVSYNECSPKYNTNDTTYRRKVEISDSLNRIIESHYIDSLGVIKLIRYFSYDKYGNLKSFGFLSKIIGEDEFLKTCQRTFEFEYDEFGNWTLKSEIIDGKLLPIVKRKIKY